MNEIASRRSGLGAQGSYFFLSYAHLPPLAGSQDMDTADPPDEWVRMFFRDLNEAVRLSAAEPSPEAPGFFDQEIPLGSDWKVVLSGALSTAEVFVPLLSPGYITKSWPAREQAYFEQRMRSVGVADPLRRFAPVLWIPLPTGEQPLGLREALARAPAAATAAYRENGLRALLRLTPYHRWYQMIVDELAKYIVDLAEKTPVGPSDLLDIDRIESSRSPDANAAAFVVVVVAPVQPELPPNGDSESYGPYAREWRPFRPYQQRPLAEYAQLIAEQLDFAVEVIDIEKAQGTFASRPGIVLIDPWYVTDDVRLNAFQSFAHQLPPWALPVIVPDPRVEQSTKEVRKALEESAISGSEPARHGLRGVTSLREFVNLMPFLVTQAEREYLRHGPIQRSAAPAGSRPRLADGGRLPKLTSPQPQREDLAQKSPAEEQPDV
jgi:FxsC-like protein